MNENSQILLHEQAEMPNTLPKVPNRGRYMRPKSLKSWCRRQDLNPQPPAYKADALPVELRRH